MNKKQQKEMIENIIKEREMLTEQLKAIAHKIDDTRPWKAVLRTELNVVI